MKISKSQIVATLGPASAKYEILSEMAKHGLDVARLNFSWSDFDKHEEYINLVRKVSQDLSREIIILGDLPGPRIQETKGHTYDNKVISCITDRDIELIKFGIKQNLDYFGLSFVGNASDVLECKKIILENGGTQKVVAKIEREVAVKNIDSIIEVADAVMVARGDLGNEIQIEKIPFVQAEIIAKAKKADKPVITATQMLLSMVENDAPTRAEVTDVSEAILQGSDAVMLSEESAIGKYPVETVKIMEKIVLEAEMHMGKKLNINSL